MDIASTRKAFKDLVYLSAEELSPKLSTEEVDAYEKQVNGKFSDDYRNFLTEICSGWSAILSPEAGIKFAMKLGIEIHRPFPISNDSATKFLARKVTRDGIPSGGFHTNEPIGGLLPITSTTVIFNASKAKLSSDCLVIRGAQTGKVWTYFDGYWYPSLRNRGQQGGFATIIDELRAKLWV